MKCSDAPAIWLPTIRAGSGADVFTQRLCDGLNARGIRAEITWFPHRAEYLPWTVPSSRPPDWANIVHVNSWLPRRFWPQRLPIVVTVHHLVHDPAYRPFRSPAQAAYHELLIRPRELAAIRDANAVTTVSGYVRRTVMAFSGRKDIAMIHNWIDNDVFSPDRTEAVHKDKQFRLFMAGSRTRRKGIDLLPSLAAALGQGFEIRYAGGRSDAQLPIPGVVELGRISQTELVHEYQACDAVVSLSRYEGFGYTALEAMACGKPFLGFRTSGLSEVVGEEGGVLVPVDDTQALAAAARGIRESLRGGMNWLEVGRTRAVQKFGAANLDGYLGVYTSLMGKVSALQSGDSDGV